MIIYSQLYVLSMLCILQLCHKLRMYNQHRKYHLNVPKFLRHNKPEAVTRCSVKIGVLRNFAKFTGKHFAKFLRTPFLQKHLRTTASEQRFDRNGLTLDNVTVRRIPRVVNLNVSVELPKSPARIIRKFFQERLIFM